MANVTVCDICLKDGKLTKAKGKIRVRKHPELRVDYCPNCKGKIPKDMKEYIKFAYGLMGIELSPEKIKNYFSDHPTR